MKRNVLFLFATALFVSFAACSGGSKKTEQQEKAVEAVETVTETPEPTYVAPTPEEALKAFEAYAKEYAEAFNNMLKDPQKFQKLAGQSQEKVADMERLKIDFTPAQLKKYEAARDIVNKINSGGK